LPHARKTFLTLDGLRGLAALLVVYHHQHLAGINDAPGGAYLAVDLFFLMSGFVIAHAYEGRLQTSMTPLAFMKLRLIRLYPLSILGSVIGLAVAIAFARLSAFHPANALELARAAISAVTLTPYFTPDLSVVAFPLNGPAWSLFFELAINLIYAVVAVRLSTRTLAVICAASGALLALLAWKAGHLNLGFQTLGFFGGLPRVAFSFFGGVILHRLYKAGRLPRLSLHPMWAMVGALALLTLPSDGGYAWLLALTTVLLGFPALLVLGVGALEPGRRLGKLFSLSGEASYPLYAVHGPLIIGLMMGSRFWGWPLPMLQPWIGFAIAPVLALAALPLSRFYDQPIRAWVSALPIRRRVEATA
jgi:peptidoglycan/LPS O-acetylase OafA/YrhL